jgi:hypothetical protein
MAENLQAKSASSPKALSPRSIQVRLFLTCWLVYGLHFSPYVYRELYLTMSLAQEYTVRVDEYRELHPDLFEIPGRGSFLGGNPGLPFLAAAPYWLTLPVVERVAPVRAAPPGETVSAEYKESRWDRVNFYRKVRQRGLDVRIGLAAAITSVFFMGPLSALSAVVIWRIFLRLGLSQRASLWLALLYAFGTPIFFRTATLNQNLLVCLVSLFSFALVWRPADAAQGSGWRYFFGGVLAGYAVFTDFTGVATLGALGLFVLLQEKGGAEFPRALRNSLPFVAGALVPIGFLLAYQWYCFGSPWYPAQFYMPREVFQGYPSERGFGWPQPAALWGLLFDPLYGLFVFAPILALALYHPVLIRQRRNAVPPRVALLAWVLFAALWVFCSCIHYTLRHQWQDGVRYMVPAVPLLFLLTADVLLRLPRALAYLLAGAAVVETWSLAMVREAPLVSLSRVLAGGLELPWLTTLIKTAPQYFPFLAEGASPLPLFLLGGLLVWLIWKVPDPGRRLGSEKGLG